MDSRWQRILAFSLTIVFPGSAHWYYGAWVRALVISGAAFIGCIGESYLAILGPWTMGLFAVFNVAFIAGVCLDALKTGRHSMHRRGNATVLFILAGVTVFFAARTLYRVQTFVIPSSSMAPTLFAGDRVAVDQRPSNYKVDDLVAIRLNDERVTVIRRISSLDPGTVTLVLDKDRDRPVALSSREDLRGRVIYLVYSIDPASWLPRWNRWMVNLF